MPNIIQLTDTHIFADPEGELYGVNTRRSLQRVLDNINSSDMSADLVLVTGDIVHDEGEDAYRVVDEMLSPLGVPVWYIPGNHDDAAVLHRCLPNSPQAGLCHTQINNWLVVLLDSSVAGRVEGQLSSQTLDMLRQVLDANTHQPVLIGVHHHAVKTGSDWMDRIGLQNGDALLALLRSYANVRLVLNGHIHQPLDEQHGHIRLLGTPSTCFQFRIKSTTAGIDTDPPAWRYLQLNDDGSFSTTLIQLAE